MRKVFLLSKIGYMPSSFTVRGADSQDAPGLSDLLDLVDPSGHTTQLVADLTTNTSISEPGTSAIATDTAGNVIGYALAVRCWVGSWPAILLEPIAIHPDHTSPDGSGGVATALIEHVLTETRARAQAANAPTLLLTHGNPAHLEPLGFEPARYHGIKTTRTHVPLLVYNLTPDFEPGPGDVTYPAEFGLDTDDDL